VVTSFTLASFEVSVSSGQIVASLLIVLLTWLNARGLREGSLVQNVFTFLKLGAIGAFVLFGLFWTRTAPPAASETTSVSGTALLTGFGVALMAALWAFDGWSNLTFSAGEVKDPGRVLPRALILGTIAVTAIYLLTNWAYLRALSIGEMQGVTRVAETAATALFGPGATSMIAGAVLVSTIGATNGCVLTGARVYYAMAKDGLFFRSIARVHPRHRTPHVALWAQGLWSCVISLTGTFDQLFTYAMFGALIMYGAATASVFTLRRRRPALERPYRVWGYPFLPALYLAALAALMLNTFFERPFESIAGLGLFLLGVPVYWFWRSRRSDLRA
jgi:APA family basic amino acid/polyamine antiporter